MNLSNRVAILCLKHYHDVLPKKGKPQKNKEWTLMAAFVQNWQEKDDLSVVAMATGSKCVGQNKMRKQGDILNDSHAEVLARRAFIRYLHHQLHLSYSGKQDSIFSPPDQKLHRCTLKDGIKFYLYTSHTPCGDASIFPKDVPPDEESLLTKDGLSPASKESALFEDGSDSMREQGVHSNGELGQDGGQILITGDKVAAHQSKQQSDSFHGSLNNSVVDHDRRSSSLNPRKRLKTVKHLDTLDGNADDTNLLEEYTPHAECQEDTWAERMSSDGRICDGQNQQALPVRDIHRTGAKCVPNGSQDLHMSGVGYQTVGVLRSKPGRGDRTLSMSCSDKMAKWNVVGCQGALLTHFLDRPVYVAAIIVGKCPYSYDAMRRALIDRIQPVSNLPATYCISKPQLESSDISFTDSKENVGRVTGNQEKISPAGAAIIWSSVPHKQLEVSVNGLRQGVTSKNIHKPEARCSVCKVEMFISFKSLVESIPVDQIPQTLRRSDLHTYHDFKMAATHYQEARSRLLVVFDTWVTKPEGYLLFS